MGHEGRDRRLIAIRQGDLRVHRPALDLAIGVVGVFAGLAGYYLLRPAPLLANPSALGYAAMVVILFLFGGVLEELVFRGLVQNAAANVFGGQLRGAVFAAALETALYSGSGSIPYALLVGGVGFVFGWALTRRLSLWGVALSHGLMLVTMAVVAQGLNR